MYAVHGEAEEGETDAEMEMENENGYIEALR
jgi:hypothetical protein